MNLIAEVRRQVLRRRTVVPVVIALGALVLGLRALLGISPLAMWAELTTANPLLVLAAVGLFYLTFPVRALRWRELLRNAGQMSLPSVGRLTRMMVLGSFGNSISVAQLGDVYRGCLLKNEADVPLPMTLGTILAERLVDLVTLVGLLAAAALTVYAGQLPRIAVDALVGGMAVSFGGMLALVALPRCQTPMKRVLPVRWHLAYARFEQGAVCSLRRLPVLAAYSALGWLIEGATLWLLAVGIGVHLSVTGALVTGLVASLLSVEPLTPGGLGVTEPGIVLVLTSLGVAGTGASTVALLNRLVNYLSLAVAGSVVVCLGSLSRIRATPLAGGDEPAEPAFAHPPSSKWTSLELGKHAHELTEEGMRFVASHAQGA